MAPGLLIAEEVPTAPVTMAPEQDEATRTEPAAEETVQEKMDYLGYLNLVTHNKKNGE